MYWHFHVLWQGEISLFVQCFFRITHFYKMWIVHVCGPCGGQEVNALPQSY